jgi:hypothetical protein
LYFRASCNISYVAFQRWETSKTSPDLPFRPNV